jgi:hypothetical protein
MELIVVANQLPSIGATASASWLNSVNLSRKRSAPGRRHAADNAAQLPLPNPNLSTPGRRWAEAVRARIDWKYLLGLDLSDPGFDFSVLSEFRARLLAGDAEERLLEKLLEYFSAWSSFRGHLLRHSAASYLGSLPALCRIVDRRL